MSKKEIIGRAFKAAFPHTIPILTGFGFLGISYGIYESIRFQLLVSVAD